MLGENHRGKPPTDGKQKALVKKMEGIFRLFLNLTTPTTGKAVHLITLYLKGWKKTKLEVAIGYLNAIISLLLSAKSTVQWYLS